MPKLTLSIFDPNTLLPHRAGIAGLALALDALSPDDAPLSWQVTEDEVRLSWEGSDRDAVTWLLGSTYQLENGYLNVPALNLDSQGRYTFTQGVTSTLLQHSQQRSLDKTTRPLRFLVEDGQPEITLEFRPVLDCYYTRDFKEAFTSKGKFKSAISLKGHHLPGLVECFISGPYQESPSGFVALLFLPLACGYYKLPGPGLRSALAIPEVTHLIEWVRRRRNLSGQPYEQFRATGAGEAGLRFLLEDKVGDNAQQMGVQYCEVYQLGKQVWDGNQPYLKQAVYRIRAQPDILKLYQRARALFPPRVQVTDTETQRTWLATSKVLPWLAENLISDRPWYCGFFEFQKSENIYKADREGLVTMTDSLTENEKVLFEAVQGAFRTLLREEILRAKAQGRLLDYEQVTDKAIYRLQRPSTKQQFSAALVEFLSRFRSNAAKGQGLEIARWIHSDGNWRQARDLALLAIATYKKKSPDASEESESGETAGEAESDSEGFEMNLLGD
ncbi:type I-MYXAN CRISPR-associated Cas8a1/Cmx1 [Lyngbya sp. CCY1209]|uniref:type I-MYXAN CRISPR-associated Cas8a1/Cmx1 n=1 Tax=Lyngbya sp. CCY1209 TaxID=2886103 RepID=UPI002D20B58C|nr:type I-MYXAN CRISPR-associated Cas8a1/Cmx1 [Lyngbya sp. CCY1209]MEB3884069.1 type I-MYXAN CRISPR-associated Cas8a1/Cmx1 [Lyngbya sp. CCY1209]